MAKRLSQTTGVAAATGKAGSLTGGRRAHWIVRLRLLTGRHICDGFECFQVEDRDVRSLSITYKSAPELGNDGDSVYTGSLRNVTHHAQGVDIEYFDLSSVRDVKAAGGFVNGEVVPTSLPRDQYLFGDRVPIGGRG